MKHPRITFSKKFRESIFERDNYTCQMCGKDLQYCKQWRILDHKIPLSKGGSNRESNLWLLCVTCDKTKSNLMIEQAITSCIENRIKEIKFKRSRHERFNKLIIKYKNQ